MIFARNSNEAKTFGELFSSYSLELYTFCDSPRILPSTNFPTILFDHGVCTHHRKRHSFSKNFMQFTFFFFLHFRELVNFYLVLRYLVQNLNNQQRQIPALKTIKQSYTVFLTNRLRVKWSTRWRYTASLQFDTHLCELSAITIRHTKQRERSLFARRYAITTGLLDNTNLFLKMSTFVWRHGVRLRDDRYNVNFVVKTLHELYIQRLQTMAGGCDEVETTMYSTVWYLPSHYTRLGVQELLVFWLDIFDHRYPTETRISFLTLCCVIPF